MGIQVGLEITVSLFFTRRLLYQEVGIQADLRIEGVCSRDPVERCLDLAAIGRVTAPRHWVIDTMNLRDLLGEGLFHDAYAFDKVRIPQSHLASRREPEKC